MKFSPAALRHTAAATLFAALACPAAALDLSGGSFTSVGAIGTGLLAILLGALVGRTIRDFAAKQVEKQDAKTEQLKRELEKARKNRK